MKKWDTNELRQQTSRLISWLIIIYMNCFRAKKVELFLHFSSLVAWPFQTEYSSKSRHLLQEYLVLFLDHKSLEAVIQDKSVAVTIFELIAANKTIKN